MLPIAAQVIGAYLSSGTYPIASRRQWHCGRHPRECRAARLARLVAQVVSFSQSCSRSYLPLNYVVERSGITQKINPGNTLNRSKVFTEASPDDIRPRPTPSTRWTCRFRSTRSGMLTNRIPRLPNFIASLCQNDPNAGPNRMSAASAMIGPTIPAMTGYSFRDGSIRMPRAASPPHRCEVAYRAFRSRSPPRGASDRDRTYRGIFNAMAHTKFGAERPGQKRFTAIACPR